MASGPTSRLVIPLARLITDDYVAGTYNQIDLVYPRFVSTLVQRPTVERLLPVEPSEDTAGHSRQPVHLRAER